MDWNARRVRDLIEAALHEDRTVADATSRLTVAPEQEAQAEITAKQDCVLAGLELPPRIFAAFDALLPPADRRPPVVVTHDREIFDGVRLVPGQVIAVLRGNARHLLACERVVLNFLQRLSGVATLTRQFVTAAQGNRARILDTRKTLPGWRALDKYAVTCGGGVNHRADLSDGVLIKNNHIRLAGGIASALRCARAGADAAVGRMIEIEVRGPDELAAALEGGARRILLDNMSPDQVRAAVAATAGRAELEVSGGVTLANVRAYAETGVDFISVGALTHSAPAVDLAMRIVPV
ncbi:MAG: carboxylating nicotinate-nucleotide diphosphorylase [Terriglobales bacterium]